MVVTWLSGYCCCTWFWSVECITLSQWNSPLCRSIGLALQYWWCVPLIVLPVWHVTWRTNGWMVLKSCRPPKHVWRWTCSKNVGLIYWIVSHIQNQTFLSKCIAPFSVRSRSKFHFHKLSQTNKFEFEISHNMSHDLLWYLMFSLDFLVLSPFLSPFRATAGAAWSPGPRSGWHRTAQAVGGGCRVGQQDNLSGLEDVRKTQEYGEYIHLVVWMMVEKTVFWGITWNDSGMTWNFGNIVC